jgi:Glycosyl transferase family 11
VSRSCKTPQQYWMKKEATFHKNFLTANPNQNVHFKTFLQSFKYISKTSLPFKRKTEPWTQQWIRKSKIERGIHIRRTDQLSSYSDKNPIPNIDYFKAAIDIVNSSEYGSNKTSRLKHSMVFVASDDINWIQNQPRSEEMTISPFLQNWSMDFAILAHCRHVIVSSGSFGWWTMYLNNQSGFKLYHATPFYHYATQGPYVVF